MGVRAQSLVRVVIADDNPVVRLGVGTALATTAHIEIVGEAGNGEEAIEQVRLHLPDVLLLDIRMPVLDGLAAIPEVSSLTRVIMLTSVDDPVTVMRALSTGAHGYLVHGEFDPAALADVVTKVARGRSVLCSRAATVLVNRLQDRSAVGGRGAAGGLTRREGEIMGLIAEGLSNRQIARRLVISEKTVKNHIVSIYRRFGVGNRGDAVSRWREP